MCKLLSWVSTRMQLFMGVKKNKTHKKQKKNSKKKTQKKRKNHKIIFKKILKIYRKNAKKKMLTLMINTY